MGRRDYKRYRISGLVADPITLSYGLTITIREFKNEEDARNWFGSHFSVPRHRWFAIRVTKV